MDLNTIISTIVGVIAGGFITWRFAMQASRELKQEATELRRLNRLMLLGMQHAGWISLNYDQAGNITGFQQTIELTSIQSSEQVYTPTVIQTPPPERNTRR